MTISATFKGDDLDPYYKLTGPLNPSTPSDIVPHLCMIRKESEWKALGFKMRKDKYGNCRPINIKGMAFSLKWKPYLDEVEASAALLGKKCARSPNQIALLIMLGCSYDDFVAVSTEEMTYCDAFLCTYRGEAANALSLIRSALERCQDEELRSLYERLVQDCKIFKGKSII